MIVDPEVNMRFVSVPIERRRRGHDDSRRLLTAPVASRRSQSSQQALRQRLSDPGMPVASSAREHREAPGEVDGGQLDVIALRLRNGQVGNDSGLHSSDDLVTDDDVA
jgi:hypothetical protein